MNSLLRRCALSLIHFYQRYISPLQPRTCRYHPTCSEYARQCFDTYTPLRAAWYTWCRVISCHPWSAGGYDPIPSNEVPHDTN